MQTQIDRQIVLDTETTGINKYGPHYYNHKIIEIGAIEIINRRLTNQCFHAYLKPNRSVELSAFKVHGISDEFLFDKPIFSDIAIDFINFINGAELIIHNASFDVGFINYELELIKKNFKSITEICTVTDTLKMARKIFPGKRNSLDALSERYGIDIKKRILHGALLDAEILSHIYLLMTGGQICINFPKKSFHNAEKKNNKKLFIKNDINNISVSTPIIYANSEEIIQHKKYIQMIKKKTKLCLWDES
ncbi:MAG: DNA polymerase III subunit epsilon [Wigglesworthia glossinidia]|nr:DNA polymerase III subunit epsilon [Wigglesworthia glossinidia]